MFFEESVGKQTPTNLNLVSVSKRKSRTLELEIRGRNIGKNRTGLFVGGNGLQSLVVLSPLLQAHLECSLGLNFGLTLAQGFSTPFLCAHSWKPTTFRCSGSPWGSLGCTFLSGWVEKALLLHWEALICSKSRALKICQ